jgi:hypothetical protein
MYPRKLNSVLNVEVIFLLLKNLKKEVKNLFRIILTVI